MPQEQIIYVEGQGFVPIKQGQTVQQAVAAKQAQPADISMSMKGESSAPAGKSALQHTEDFVTGAAKGVGDTAGNLGNAVHSIPILGNITDFLATHAAAPIIGKLTGQDTSGTNPGASFKGWDAAMEPAKNNTGEHVGKLIEQVLEFFLPGGKAGTAAQAASGATDAVLNLPKAAGPVRRALTDMAFKGSRMAGDAAAAGAVSAAHGDKDPQYAAAGQLGGSLLGEGASQFTKLLASKSGQDIGPYIAGMLAMAASHGLGPEVAGGAGLGTFGLSRMLARRALRAPGAVGKLGWMAEQGGDTLGKVAAGGIDQARAPQRRK